MNPRSALPGSPCGAIGRMAPVWLLCTALLLATRRVSGWPLLVAAGVALASAGNVVRRLGAATAAIVWRTDPSPPGHRGR